MGQYNYYHFIITELVEEFKGQIECLEDIIKKLHGFFGTDLTRV